MTLRTKNFLVAIILIVGLASAFAVGYLNNSYQQKRQEKAATALGSSFVNLLSDGKAKEAYELTSKKANGKNAEQFTNDMKNVATPNGSKSNGNLFHSGDAVFYSETVSNPNQDTSTKPTIFYLTLVRQKSGWKVDSALVI